MHGEFRVVGPLAHGATRPVPSIVEGGWTVIGGCTRPGDIGERGIGEVVIACAPTERNCLISIDSKPGSVACGITAACFAVERSKDGDEWNLVGNGERIRGHHDAFVDIVIPSGCTKGVTAVGVCGCVKIGQPWNAREVVYSCPQCSIIGGFNEN